MPDADGLDDRVGEVVRAALVGEPAVAGVYSIGGGNLAVTRLLAETGRVPIGYVAHDLDADNRGLLAQRAITFVLHHNLRNDLRAACHQVLRFHRLLPGSPRSVTSPVEVITPYNLPSAATR